MRLSGSDKALLAALGVLAIVSITIKAVAGPARDGWTDISSAQVTGELRQRLQRQGFTTSVRPLKIQSPIVLGERGGCRLSVRDARGGAALMNAFGRDAAGIGRVRYLYKGREYPVVPALRIRFGRLETEIFAKVTRQPLAHIPLALAASAECGANDFGLREFSLRS